MPKIIKYWLPVLFCMGFIFYYSSVPASDIPPLFAFQDIVFHLFAYLILALFFSRALKNTYSDITPANIVLFTVVFGIIYGISDELHQSFVPMRSVSGFDVLIDGIASFIGGLIYPVRK